MVVDTPAVQRGGVVGPDAECAVVVAVGKVDVAKSDVAP